MSNPFFKKNPFMSLWLSGANAVAGKLRGQAVAQAKRHAGTAATKAPQGLLDLWTNALQRTRARRKPTHRR